MLNSKPETTAAGTFRSDSVSPDQRRFYRAGIEEGYRRVLASAKSMTREMLIQWLEAEVNDR